MNKPFMRKGEFARHRGVKPSAVSNWNKRGFLVFAEGPGGQMLVDVAKTEARLNAKLDTTRGRPTTGMQAGMDDVPEALDTPDAPDAPEGGDRQPVINPRMELVRENVVEKRLKNLEKARELVALEEYERRSTEKGRQTRERVMGVVRDMADRLAVETNPRTIVALQQEAFDRMFADLALDVEQDAMGEDLAEAELADAEAPEEDAA